MLTGEYGDAGGDGGGNLAWCELPELALLQLQLKPIAQER